MPPEKRKLTKPQERLLREIAKKPQHVVDYYPPGKALREAGLVKEIGGWLTLSAAGQEWLEVSDAP
jgi:hypothetical protein